VVINLSLKERDLKNSPIRERIQCTFISIIAATTESVGLELPSIELKEAPTRGIPGSFPFFRKAKLRMIYNDTYAIRSGKV